MIVTSLKCILMKVRRGDNRLKRFKTPVCYWSVKHSHPLLQFFVNPIRDFLLGPRLSRSMMVMIIVAVISGRVWRLPPDDQHPVALGDSCQWDRRKNPTKTHFVDEILSIFQNQNRVNKIYLKEKMRKTYQVKVS